MTFGRVLYAGAGWCAVGFAFAGIFVPGLPVTIFVIAASYCFARSSPRFEAWLLANRWFGPRLQTFRDSGGMPRSAKRTALLSMWTAVTISSLLLLRVKPAAAVATIALAAVGTVAILFAVRTTGN